MIRKIVDTIDIWRTYNKLYEKGFIRQKPYTLRQIWKGVDVLYGESKR